MSIEELLKLPPDRLEAMSDAELHDYFAPYLEFIQPIKPEEHTQPMRATRSKYSEEKKAMDLASRLAKQLGLKI